LPDAVTECGYENDCFDDLRDERFDTSYQNRVFDIYFEEKEDKKKSLET